jgi:hypothetical protein
MPRFQKLSNPTTSGDSAVMKSTLDPNQMIATPSDEETDTRLKLVADSVADELLAPYMDKLVKQSIAHKVRSVPGVSELLGKLGYPVPNNLELLLA